jgi:hypothetical protein
MSSICTIDSMGGDFHNCKIFTLKKAKCEI